MPPRRPKSVAKYIHTDPRKDVVTRRILSAIGDTEIKELLEYNRGTEDARPETMLGLMADPRHSGKTTTRLLQLAGYTRKDVVRMYNDYKADEMRVRLSKSLPALADDMARDSLAEMRVCRECKGAGTVPGADPAVGPLEEKCVECSGNGKVRVKGDHDSRKLLLEVSGLVKKGAGFGVNINMGPGSAVDSFDSMISRVNDLMQDQRTVDTSAEAVE